MIWNDGDPGSKFVVLQSDLYGHRGASRAFRSERRGKHDATRLHEWQNSDGNYFRGLPSNKIKEISHEGPVSWEALRLYETGCGQG